MKKLVLIAALALACLSPLTAAGAIITDIQSSFDKDDPFDLKLTLGYEWNYHNTLITREALQSSQIVAANKLEYDRMWHAMHVGLAIGLYRDLEIVFDLPVIFADQVAFGINNSFTQQYVVMKADQERKAAVIIAEGESESARLISQATRSYGQGLIELRRIEAAKEIAAELAGSRNVVYLPNQSNMLLGMNAG